MFGRILGFVGLSTLAAVSMAGPQTFAQRVQTIRAGVVILDSAKSSLTAQPQSAGPYVLYNLDSNTSVKPTGWSFYNPYAASRVTPAIYSRWSALDSTTPPVGTPINKRNAAYWEVFLSQVSDTVLANYDLLVVNPSLYASLNPTEQNRLRRFVDNGGVLWIDPAGLQNGTAGVDQFNNFPIPFVPVSGGAGGPQTDFTNSLMNSVVTLAPSDINILNASSPTSYVLQGVNFGSDGAGSIITIAGGAGYDFNKLQLVSELGSQPTIALGRIGEGVVVITSRGASIKLNRSQESTSYLSNAGFTALDPILEQDGLTAAKLAVNMVGLLRDSRQQAASSRKTNSTAIDISPPLLQRSSINDPNYGINLTSANFSNNTPALYKGLLVTTVNGYVKVYDANPIVDLDGDGNTDDGLQDYSLGATYDEIWQSSQLTGPLSAPVCSEVPGSSPGQVQDEVLVIDGAGTLHIFNLTPKNANGTLSGVAFEAPPVAPPNGSPVLDASVTGVPMAPTVHEGVAYITDTVQPTGSNSGRIWAVDLQTGTYVNSEGPFVLGGNNSSVSFPEFSYSPTVGYIPILDNSGGVDKVLYSPFVPNLNAGVNAAGFLSVWIGAKGEVPSTYEPTAGNTGTALVVTTRASTHGGLPIFTGGGTRGVKLTILDANGNPWQDSTMAQYFSGIVNDLGGGVLNFPFAGGHNSLPSNITGVRVDYTIDWGNTTQGALSSIERGRVVLPDIAQGPTRIINGGVALSPQGTAYVVNSNESASGPTTFGSRGGGLYGFREQGVGLFNCVARHELYDSHTEVLNQATNVTVPAVLSDFDANLQSFQPQILGNSTLSNFEIRGGPSIRNGQVFVTASAVKATNTSAVPLVPATIIMAFNAEPQTPSFIAGNLSDGTEILQADFARSTNQTAPENQSVLGSGSYSYDATTGIISFPNLMNVQRGQIQNCLSLTQPIIIRQPGTQDTLVYPDAVGGSVWNQMQWFHVIDGAYPSGATPFVTGNSVFVSLDSYLPNILNGSYTGGVPVTSGILYSVTAQIPASQLHPLIAKPWLNQLWTIDSLSPFTADPNILWPQLTSASSFTDFVIKLNQTVLNSNSRFAYGMVGGDNALAAWGDTGLYTFAKANFLVCDEGRIVQFDPSGNPLWSTDASASAGQSAINSSANVHAFVKPVKAYALSDSLILFADAGANRVATINTNGIESRSISSFMLDPNIAPAGYSAGETLKLNGPRDALYYTTYTNLANATNLVTIGDGETTSNYEYWQHYLIADTGNKRLVEVIDRFYYNPSTGLIGQPVTVNNVPQVGVLLWHSPINASGNKYAYSSVSRVKFPDANGGHYVYVCGIGGTLPTRVGNGLDAPSPTALVNAQDGSGGIVIYDPANAAGVVTYSAIITPDVSQTSFWDPATGQFDSTINQNTTDGQLTYVRRKGGVHRLTNLNSVTAKIETDSSGNPLVAIMVADGTGVYEVTYSLTQGATQTLSVDWMMPNEVFRNIQQGTNNGSAYPLGTNALDLRALFARRLDSGEVLIVNGYYGTTLGGSPFTGEVMQVNGAVNTANFALTNLGFGSQSITLDLRTAGSTAFRGLLMPVFADRR